MLVDIFLQSLFNIKVVLGDLWLPALVLKVIVCELVSNYERIM